MRMFVARATAIALAVWDDEHNGFGFRQMIDPGQRLSHDFALWLGPWYLTLDGSAY